MTAGPEALDPPDYGPSCHNCHHVSYPYGATRCLLFNEEIIDERRAADDCPEYAPEENP